MTLGAVSILVAGVELVEPGPYLLANTLQVTDQVEERSTCSFTVIDDAGTWNPRKGEPVAISYQIAGEGTLGSGTLGSGTLGTSVGADEAEPLFGGFIDAVTKGLAIPGTTTWHHQVSCVDNHYCADKRVVARSYVNESCGAIVTDIIDRYLADEGVTAGTVDDGPTVVEAVFNYVYADEALDALVERSGFTWRIDTEKALHFHARTADPAPFDIDDTTVLRPAGGLGLTIDDVNPEYRNRQYVRGGTDLTDPQVETRPGDGETRAFTMSYPLAEAPTVEVDGVPGTVGIRGVDTGKEWYWSKGDAVVSQDSSGTVLEAADLLEVTYVGEFAIIVLVEDAVGISGRQTVEDGGTGYVEAVFDVSAESTRLGAVEIAKAKLARYGVDGNTVRFDTREAGLHAGMVITADIDDFGIDGEEFLVASVTTVDEGPFLLRRTVTAVQGPVLQSWVRLLASPSTSPIDLINVGSGTILALLVTTAEAATWSETTDQTVYACSVPDAALYPAEALLPC